MEKFDDDNKQILGSDWKAKGQRLMLLRDIAHLERDALASFAGVARKTYKDWEIGVANLSEKRAKWIVNELQARGISCDLEWLLTGEGTKPQRERLIREQITHLENNIKQKTNNSTAEQQTIVDELDYFCNKHQDSIGLVITDEAMLPIYNTGDAVAGVQRTKDNINSLLGVDCIVKFSNGGVLLRNLNQGRTPGTYTLLCSNKDFGTNILYDQEVVSAAPILWHRRLDKW